MRCPGQTVTNGWWRDRAGCWWAVDACADHADTLGTGPSARFRPAPGGPCAQSDATPNRGGHPAPGSPGLRLWLAQAA